MTETEVVTIMRVHLEGQFPKDCPTCHRHYANLRDYIQITQRLEPSISYDAEMGMWRPFQPLGTVTFTNCPCGTTLSLSSRGMPLHRLWSLYRWARIETRKRNMAMHELLSYLRDEIRRQVIATPDAIGHKGPAYRLRS